MTVARLISPAVRAGLMVSMGALLINVPLIAGLSAAAFVVGVPLGAFSFGLGLAGSAREGRGTLSPTALADLDRGLAIGLLFAAGAFAVTGEPIAVALFGAGALTALFVAGFARYSASPAY